MRIGENQAVGRNDHAGPDAARESLRAVLERDFPHVDANHGIEQPVKSATHARDGIGSRDGQNQSGKEKVADD